MQQRGALGTKPKLDPLQQRQQRRTQQQQQAALQKRRKAAAANRAGMPQRRRKAEEIPRVLPRNESLMSNATFSACLLIKDDNDILPEWLAYHYHVINLRHLIVAIDPLSSQSPSEILQRWRLMTNLDVLEWNDTNFMPEEFLEKGTPPEEYMQKPEDFGSDKGGASTNSTGAISPAALLEISNHRYRQRVFLAQCMKRHRKMGNSWVIHIDTDEYVVASKLLRQMKPDYLKIQPMDEPGSVLNLIQQAVSRTSSLVSYPCISMLRVLFGSVESPAEDRDAMVPPGYNASSFETLRWK